MTRILTPEEVRELVREGREAAESFGKPPKPYSKPNGKKCHCGGQVVEHHGYDHRFHNGIVGPGGSSPFCLLETSCDRCGLLYRAGGGI